jgi:hypothetical protein
LAVIALGVLAVVALGVVALAVRHSRLGRDRRRPVRDGITSFDAIHLSQAIDPAQRGACRAQEKTHARKSPGRTVHGAITLHTRDRTLHSLLVNGSPLKDGWLSPLDFAFEHFRKWAAVYI